MPRREYTPQERETAFWSKVSKDGPTTAHMDTPCWVWTAATASGYGTIKWHNRRMRGAHVVAYELAHEQQVSAGLRVLHRCDNPPCVNPEHLHLGTQTDNMREASARGRTAAGEHHGRAVLTEADVIAIRTANAAGESGCSIARRMGVGKQQISRIVRGENWARALTASTAK